MTPPNSEDPTRLDPECPECGSRVPRGGECLTCSPTRAGESRPRPAFTGPRRVAQYRILREIGSGGMGAVFEAHDEKMDRRVALKILSRHHAPSARAGDRFERESWIAGRLSHPNLVKVFDRGEWEELSYYSMELCEGGSLADVVENMKRWGRDDRLGLQFGSDEYLRWVLRQVIVLARALDHAHGQGVVHRDIKPLNLLVDSESDAVKITDFGLAMDEDATRVTTEGSLLGTLAYMAPEQVLGKRDLIDGRTDVYALGVTLFELLTLEKPYEAKTRQLYLNAVLTSEARRAGKLNARVGRDLEIVLHKALEKAPKDRYRTAGAFADDLDNVLHYRPIDAQPLSVGRRLGKWIRRRPIHAALIAVLLVGTPVVGVLTQRAVELGRLAAREQVAALHEQVRLLGLHNEHRQLLAPATSILRLAPDDVDARLSRAMALLSLASTETDEQEAARLAENALADVARLAELHPGAGWPHRLEARVLRSVGRTDEAERVAARAAGLEEGESFMDRLLDGRLAYDAEDYAGAVAPLSLAVAQRPADRRALDLRARALERSGRLDEAIQDYRVLLALDPDDWINQHQMGLCLRRTGALQESAAFTLRAVELRPDDPDVHHGLADLHAELGRQALSSDDTGAALRSFEQAEASARRSLALREDSTYSQINLGSSLIEQYRLRPDPATIEEAMRAYGRAVELSEGKSDRESRDAYALARSNMCDLLIEAGRPDEALPACLEVTELIPDSISFYNLAGVHARLGRADEAFAALEKNVELGDRDWRYLETDEWFAGLRDDPRFRRLLDRMREESKAEQ